MIDRKTKILPGIRPNVGIERAYRRRILALLEEMNRSVMHWIIAEYRANEPRVAMDATPADRLRIALRKLSRRWNKNFDEGAKAMAEYFSKSASQRTDKAFQAMLKKNGMSIKFKMTPAMRDVLGATVNQNVALIKSIPEQYLKGVEGAVMRSVQAGRDLSYLSKKLQNTYGVSKRRAAFIALDQNNKATAAMHRARQMEMGIEEAVWVHSHAGKEPRPTHLANNGKRYDVKKGWFDPAVKEYIMPGELPRCRCTSRSVIKGF
jgi:SPP1 gp7 family putative phage head morphogenesis protein